LDSLKDEMRGAIVHMAWSGAPVSDWNAVAQTYYDGGLNTAVIETYPSHLILGHFTELDTAIAAFHARGLRAHILNTVNLQPLNDNMRMRAANGSLIDKTCPVRAASKATFQTIFTNLATNYALDGFQYDYIRWPGESGGGECYCDECHAKFIADTGLSNTVWPVDAQLNGRYHWQFIQWRIAQITLEVESIRGWMIAQKPSLEFGVAVFTGWSNQYSYPAMDVGQDPADWVIRGLVEHINPMCYKSDMSGGVESFQDYFLSSRDIMAGGTASRKGAVPFIPWIMIGGTESAPTPAVLAQQVEYIRNNGGNGFLIWRYGGPGQTSHLDIRPFLQAIASQTSKDLFQVLEISNISVRSVVSGIEVSWQTSSSVPSVIEYSANPLFKLRARTNEYGRNFTYYDCDYVNSSLVTDATPKTSHAITLSAGQGPYFRVVASDIFGTSFSKVYATVTQHRLTISSNPSGLPFILRRM